MTDLPPIEYLDRAAVAATSSDWKSAKACGSPMARISIIAHARALQRIAELEADMPDQDVLDVQELLAVWSETPDSDGSAQRDWADDVRSGKICDEPDFLATLATFRQIIARRGL